jgi:hypothetical protein
MPAHRETYNSKDLESLFEREERLRLYLKDYCLKKSKKIETEFLIGKDSFTLKIKIWN